MKQYHSLKDNPSEQEKVVVIDKKGIDSRRDNKASCKWASSNEKDDKWVCYAVK